MKPTVGENPQIARIVLMTVLSGGESSTLEEEESEEVELIGDVELEVEMNSTNVSERHEVCGKVSGPSWS